MKLADPTVSEHHPPTTQSMPVALSMAKLETQLQFFCRSMLKLLINLPFSSRFHRFSPPHLVICVTSVKSILKNYSFGELELVVNRSMWSFNFINAILLKMMKSDCK